jgi:hypothetical protein
MVPRTGPAEFWSLGRCIIVNREEAAGLRIRPAYRLTKRVVNRKNGVPTLIWADSGEAEELLVQNIFHIENSMFDQASM